MQAFLVATIMGKVVDEIEAWGQAELCPKSIRVRKIQLVGFCVSGGFVAVRYSYIAASETYEIEKGRFSEHTKCEKCSITFPSGQALFKHLPDCQPFRCTKCDSTFPSNTTLHKHVRGCRRPKDTNGNSNTNESEEKQED